MRLFLLFSNTVLYSFDIVMLFFTLSEIFTQSVDSFQVCNHSLRVKYNMMTLLWVICLTFVWKDQTGRSHFLPMTLRNGLMEWGKILLAESKASALQASKGVWQLKYGVMSRSLWPDQDSFMAHLSIRHMNNTLLSNFGTVFENHRKSLIQRATLTFWVDKS